MIPGGGDRRLALEGCGQGVVKSVHLTLRFQTLRGKLGEFTDAPRPDDRWEQHA